jgi:hypothetical protein
MIIKKYLQYIKEVNEEDMDDEGYVGSDTPESYIKSKLSIIKNDIEGMFGDEPKDTGEESSADDPDIEKKVKNSDETITFEDLGLKLESSEMSYLTKTHQNLTVKFSDEVYYYTIIFRIDLKQVTNKEDTEKEIDLNDIQKCFVKFKKYKIEGFELIGEITDNVDIDNINEDYLLNLKLELDEKFGGDDSEGLSIEYE